MMHGTTNIKFINENFGGNWFTKCCWYHQAIRKRVFWYAWQTANLWILAENFDPKFADLSCSNDPVCHVCFSVVVQCVFTTCVCIRCVPDQGETKL